MTKKETKAAQAQFHAFIKSQQKPEIETNITFLDDGEERSIPVKIKLRLSSEEQIMFVNRVVDFCRDTETGEIYLSNSELGFKIALMEYFTDIKERIKADDIIAFLDCFDLEDFLYAESESAGETGFFGLKSLCQAELKWAQEQYLNFRGVNGVFVKLNDLIDKIDTAMDSMGGYMDKDKIETLLDAVKTVSQAPEAVAEKVIEVERARVAEMKTEK